MADESHSRTYHLGFIGAMAGGGFGYSMTMGYGPLHGLGMAVAQFVIAVVLVLAAKGATKAWRFAHA